VLEGLASGCRIVATDLPGVKEVLGDVQLDCISLVKTPRLRFQDQPFQEDEPAFEQDLARALQTQINAVYRGHDTDLTLIHHKVVSFSWSRVFDRVLQVYLEARAHRTGGGKWCHESGRDVPGDAQSRILYEGND
jgi:glycosyltransferase involved in cell wall biosynthesis